MSNSTPFVTLAAVLMIGSSIGAGWSGYEYHRNSIADSYYLTEASELRSSALQAIYLSERAASDSNLVDELDRLDAAISTSFGRVQNGDPLLGVPPAPQNLVAQAQGLRDTWDSVSTNIAKIIASKSSTESFTRARLDVQKSLAATVDDAEAGFTRYKQVGGTEGQIATLRAAIDSLNDASAVINRTSIDTEALRSAEAAISSFLGSVSAIARSIPKDQQLFESMRSSYRGAQTTQQLVARLIDSSTGASSNTPFARAIWAERDRVNAASNTLVEIAKSLKSTHLVQPLIVALLGTLAAVMALITSIVALRNAATRTQVLETRGNSILGSQKERSKELSILLNDISEFGEGNISHTVADDKESTKEIAKRLNVVFGKIKNIIEESNQTISGLSAATEQTLMTARNVDRNSHQQLRALEHISGLIKALADYIGQVQAMTNTADTVAQDVAIKVRSGSQAVTEVHEGILLLSETNTGIQHRSKSLIESFQTLERISTVVNQVAERSDLVAWNAHLVADSIESSTEVARAMNASASSITTLAGQCRKAVGEIEVILKTMSDAARETQLAVDGSQRGIDGLLGRSNNAQAALSDIQHMTSTLSQSVSDVTKSTQSLKTQADDMETSMVAVMNYSSENAAASEQTAQAVSNVNRSAQEMQQLIFAFTKGK